MPFKKGVPRVATAGRKKGSVNKKTAEIFEILAKHKFNPIEELIDLYRRTDSEERTVGTAGKLLTELLQYIYPKRKAIEHTGKEGEPIQVEMKHQFDERTLEELSEWSKRMHSTLQNTPKKLLGEDE